MLRFVVSYEIRKRKERKKQAAQLAAAPSNYLVSFYILQVAVLATVMLPQCCKEFLVTQIALAIR
jgi:hypothetical protein